MWNRTRYTKLLWAAVMAAATALLSITANAQDDRRPLPNTEELRKAPIPFKPITISELRQYKPGLLLGTRVKLKNGKAIAVRDLIRELNKLERLLNGYGYSLRDNQDRPTVLDRTYLRLTRTDTLSRNSLLSAGREQSKTINSAVSGALMQFPTNSASWTVMDPDFLGAKLEWTSSAANSFSTVKLEDNLTLTGYVNQTGYTLVDIRGRSIMPTGMAIGDPARSTSAKMKLVSFEVSSGNATDTGSGTAVVSMNIPPQNKSISAPKFRTTIGPIPVSITIGLNAWTAASGNASTALQIAKNEFKVSAGVSAWFKALVDVGVIGAGGEASIDMLRYDYSYINTAEIGRLPIQTSQNPAPEWEKTEINWSSADGYQIESGSGAIALIIEIDAHFFSRKFSKEIISWDGHVWSQPLQLPAPITLIRPAGCGAPYMQNAMCALPPDVAMCKRLENDSDNCGGCGVVCANGKECVSGYCVKPAGPKGHECPASTLCCEPNPNPKQGDGSCLGACFYPGHHSQCPQQ